MGDLRREKSHYHPANGYKFVLRFHFWCSCDNFTCYASAFKPLTAGAQRFPSGILREYASDIPTQSLKNGSQYANLLTDDTVDVWKNTSNLSLMTV